MLNLEVMSVVSLLCLSSLSPIAASQYSGMGTREPCCTLHIRTDNDSTVDVWIDRKNVGVTPLVLEGIRPGVYDVGFMEPSARDSILEKVYGLSDTSNQVSRISSTRPQSVFGRGVRSVDHARASLALESYKKIRLKGCMSREVVFAISQARQEKQRLKGKGSILVIIGSAIALASVLFVVLTFTSYKPGP